MPGAQPSNAGGIASSVQSATEGRRGRCPSFRSRSRVASLPGGLPPPFLPWGTLSNLGFDGGKIDHHGRRIRVVDVSTSTHIQTDSKGDSKRWIRSMVFLPRQVRRPRLPHQQCRSSATARPEDDHSARLLRSGDRHEPSRTDVLHGSVPTSPSLPAERSDSEHHKRAGVCSLCGHASLLLHQGGASVVHPLSPPST